MAPDVMSNPPSSCTLKVTRFRVQQLTGCERDIDVLRTQLVRHPCGL